MFNPTILRTIYYCERFCRYLRDVQTGRVVLIIGILTLWMNTAGYAQNRQQLATSFERDVNRYRWVAGLEVEQAIKSWQLSASNQFTSDAFILFNNLLSFRDENHLYWALSKNNALDKKRAIPRFNGSLAWYSQSQVLTQDLYASTFLRYKDVLQFKPALGFALDQRPGAKLADDLTPIQTDAGPAASAFLRFNPNPTKEYSIDIEASGNIQMIRPRLGRSAKIAGTAERLFQSARLGSTFSYSNVRRDTYEAISFLNRDTDTNLTTQTIEATTSDTLFVGISLDTPIAKNLNLTTKLDFNTNHRKIRTYQAPDQSLFFDTDFDHRAVDAQVGLLYQTRTIYSHLTLKGGAETEQRQLANRDNLPPVQATQKGDLLKQADYDRSFLSLQMRNTLHLTNALSVQLGGLASILRHDTPDLNQDDRDEAFFNGLMGIKYRINRYLQTHLDVFGSYYHTVYLKARRSAENNEQRTLRFRPTVIWTPAQTTSIRLSSEVRATYTVDDFILEGRRPTDQSARELRYEAEVNQDLGNQISVNVTGGLSDLRLGRFLQDDFAEIPFDTLQTYSGWFRLRSESKVTAEVGVRFFIRTDFERANTVRYRRIDENGNFVLDDEGRVLKSTITRPGRRWIEQIGPTFAITLPMPKASAIRLDGWLNVQHIRQRLYGDLPEDLGRHIQKEARKGTRKIIPNIALSVIWNL